jgi:hypothetical protein
MANQRLQNLHPSCMKLMRMTFLPFELASVQENIQEFGISQSSEGCPKKNKQKITLVCIQQISNSEK